MSKIIIIAILCEAVWETLKMTWQKDKYLTIDRIGALAIGVLIAFATNVDILELVGIESSIPNIGILFCGILISRGANFIHEFYNKLNPTNHQKEFK